MNKTAIEYGRNPDGSQGYSWPIVTGCKRGCEYCWARRLFSRFRWSFEPTLHVARLNAPLRIRKPSRILTCFTGDLFGPWIKPEWGWHKQILDVVRQAHWHTFLFLTKYPEALAQFNPWPSNAWVGATATNNAEAYDAIKSLDNVDAIVRYLSIEPLLANIGGRLLDGLDWVIIGAQTGPDAKPIDQRDVHELLDGADHYGIPVFLKDNLRWHEKRQEWPEGVE